jgi:hypothetical protein
MAASSYTYFLHNSILTTVLLLARLATSTLLNPSIQPDITCFAPEIIQDKPAAFNCGMAIVRLPYSTDPTDYHRDPASGRVIYTTGLTSVGDPSSHLHLPLSSWSGDCRIDIRMSQQVQVANVLWDDVRQAAYELVERCVGSLPIVPSPSGPGGGGTAQLGSVLISMMYTRDLGRPGTARVRPGSAPSRPGAGAGSGWSIGAHYPSAANA